MIYTHDEYRKAKNYRTPPSSLHQVREMNRAKHLQELSEANNIETVEEKFNLSKLKNNKKIEEIQKVNKIKNDTEELTESILLNSLSNVFLESLVLDKEFVDSNRTALQNVFKVELANLAETATDLLNYMKNSDSYYLNEMAKKVEEKAAKDANDISKGVKDKDLAKEDKVDHRDTPEAVEMIKSKVLKTIKKENELSKQEKDIQDEFTKAKELNEDVKIFYKTPNVRSFSLFKSIMMNSYKSSVKNVLNENTVSENAHMDKDGNVTVDNDKILAESIIKYTMLETLNTLQLKKFDARSVKRLADRYAYQRF